MTKAILPMNLSDLIISGKFGENYSKVLYTFFNTFFDYTTFEITENGIFTMIQINVKYGSEIIPLCFSFKSKYYSTEITLSVSCMYTNLFGTCDFVYKNFVEFLDIFDNVIINHEDFQKFYIV